MLGTQAAPVCGPAVAGQMIRELLQEEKPVIQFPRGKFFFDEPLHLPDYPVTVKGAGIGATELIFTGEEGSDGIIAERSDSSGPVTLEGFTISSVAKRGGTALTVRYPVAGIPWNPTLIVTDVQIRPSDFSERWPGRRGGGWSQGVQLDYCDGAKLTNLLISGHNAETSAASLRSATMHVAIDIGNSMCVGIARPSIQNCNRAIQSIVGEVGRAEGLQVFDDGFLMNVMVGIWCESTMARLIPSLQVRGIHCYSHSHSIVALGRSSVVISDCELSQHHESPDWHYGAYIARSEYSRLTGNAFWRGREPRQGTGLCLVDVHDSTVNGNSFSTGLAQGVLAMACTNLRGAGNSFASGGVQYHRGSNNQIS